jgi:hypothetical protein
MTLSPDDGGYVASCEAIGGEFAAPAGGRIWMRKKSRSRTYTNAVLARGPPVSNVGGLVGTRLVSYGI